MAGRPADFLVQPWGRGPHMWSEHQPPPLLEEAGESADVLWQASCFGAYLCSGLPTSQMSATEARSKLPTTCWSKRVCLVRIQFESNSKGGVSFLHSLPLAAFFLS